MIDNNLAVPIMLLMAQQRNCVVYEETADSHLKLVGKLFDQVKEKRGIKNFAIKSLNRNFKKGILLSTRSIIPLLNIFMYLQCQDTLVQFGSFLACNLSIDDYTRRLPPMNELLTRYHVNSDLAFFLARPMFNHQISLKVRD